MTKKDWEKIYDAVKLVEQGTLKRVEVNDNIKVYVCGTVIRVDIKTK